MITQNELNEMQARADAATPGEWGVVEMEHDYLLQAAEGDVSGKHRELHILTAWEHPQLHDRAPVVYMRGCISKPGEGPLYVVGMNNEDANFIAHARADVPRLIEEVRRLQSELAALTQKS